MHTRLLMALLVGMTMLIAPLAAQDRGEPRVVMISIDGLMPSSYTSPSSPALNLRKMASEGAWADGVVGVLPTVTYPSHTTLITGVDPAVHGIVDNRIFDPENRSNGAWYWYARDIRVPTLPMAARARGLRAAAVAWPVTIGMDLDYVVPEYWRSNHPEALSMMRALSQPRNLLESAEIARGKPFEWPQTDRDRTDLTKFIIRTFDPHVLLLHIIELDGAQHSHGPGSPEAHETLARVDGFVGEIVETIRASGRPTHVAIVSDHGFLPACSLRPGRGGWLLHRQRCRSGGEAVDQQGWPRLRSGSDSAALVVHPDRPDRATPGQSGCDPHDAGRSHPCANSWSEPFSCGRETAGASDRPCDGEPAVEDWTLASERR